MTNIKGSYLKSTEDTLQPTSLAAIVLKHLNCVPSVLYRYRLLSAKLSNCR